MQAGVGPGSGEETQAKVVWAVGVVRARGGVGTHWQPLNTLCQPGVSSGEARGGMGCGRWGWCGRGGVWARIGSLLSKHLANAS